MICPLPFRPSLWVAVILPSLPPAVIQGRFFHPLLIGRVRLEHEWMMFEPHGRLSQWTPASQLTAHVTVLQRSLSEQLWVTLQPGWLPQRCPLTSSPSRLTGLPNEVPNKRNTVTWVESPRGVPCVVPLTEAAFTYSWTLPEGHLYLCEEPRYQAWRWIYWFSCLRHQTSDAASRQ